MSRPARLVASLDAPSPVTGFDTAPCLMPGPGARFGTTESDEEYGAGRHWLVAPASPRPLDRITYPREVSGPPRALGDGSWYTVSAADSALHVWAL
ncbi:hypothetical protein ACFY9X_28210 [Streptomyces nigra]|uniref:hypothetical protein n=1 Tax=Streptomyces nigra TaxID=1827580 RepID=UPI0036EB4315